MPLVGDFSYMDIKFPLRLGAVISTNCYKKSTLIDKQNAVYNTDSIANSPPIVRYIICERKRSTGPTGT